MERPSTAGNVVDESRGGAPPYGYNPEGRPWLESVAVDGSVVSSYDYDSNGNRVAVELSWSQLGYDAEFDTSLTPADTEYNDADQLLTYGTKSYTWNNFGQLESMYDSATDETTTYEYDLYGNLLSVGLPDGRTIEYDVDGAGRRVGRRELDAQGNEISFRGWIYRDLLRPIAEVDALGNVTARYIYSDGDGARQNGVGQLATRLGAYPFVELPYSGLGVPEVIQFLAPNGSVQTSVRLVLDKSHSVRAAVDLQSGEVLQRLEYDEFGRVILDSNPGLQPFGFAGGLVEPDTEFVRFGARDMDPTLGRWTSRDPVLFLGKQWNLYVYAESSPLRFEDRAGLFFDASSAAGYSGGAAATAGLICLGFSNPVGWGLIGAGIALGGLSYYLSGENVTDNMSDADEALEPVRDRRKRDQEKWDEYDNLVNN